ncbi:MAG: hypothetical protein JSS81_07600 [Acidobacteria bacterium]|nr:hypothetical protein [Acidobacteriota bacterium]
MTTVLFIGALYNLAFFLFHLLFWKIFGWKTELRTLGPINRGVMQILNLRLMWVFLVFAYVSAFYGHDLVTSGLGRTLLAAIALFWLMRAVEQIVFFGLRSAVSVGLTIVFLIGAALYFYPLTSAFPF